ncbi:MAG: DUF547 domain-containing protein [Cytophagales bacterium]|nr:DUF547 domain-containing protein [Cytophagales bacterium]
MRKIIFVSFAVFILFQHCLSEAPSKGGSKPVNHEEWTQLLSKYVDVDGLVNYGGFQKDSLMLNAYLEKLVDHPPDEKSWSQKEQIAYWVNVYNAFTIKLIIQHYPLESIKDIGSKIQIPFINSPWDIRFITINGEKLDLNNVEHSILRKKFDEPRIHFAINCASFSCPKLRNEAYTAERLDKQLDEQALDFINDRQKNDIRPDRVELSKIFSWFKSDFTKNSSLREFINQYAKTKIGEKTKISFMKYDWSLNVQR